MASKKFFWLKLKKTFFHQKEIKLLRRIAGGDTYTIIYLKMMLLSIENEGTIFFDNVTETFEEELALELDEQVENVQVTLNFLKAKGLLEIKDTDEFFLNEVPSMIGKETDSAERVRRHRRKKQEALPLQSNNKALPCNGKVTKGNTEIDIDIDIEKEREKEIEQEQEIKQEKKSSVATADKSSETNAHSFYQNNFGVENSITIQNIDMWINDLSEELVIEAMSRAALDQKGYRYAEGIMKNWDKKNIRTMEQVIAEDVAFSNRKGSNSINQNKTAIDVNDEYGDLGW